MTKYGLITGDFWFEADGKSHRLPVPELELAQGGAPKEASYRQWFPWHGSETAIAYDALSGYYFQWGDLLTGIKLLVSKHTPEITILRDELQRPKMAKFLAPKVKAYLKLTEEARTMAQDGLDYVEVIRDRLHAFQSQRTTLKSRLAPWSFQRFVKRLLR